MAVKHLVSCCALMAVVAGSARADDKRASPPEAEELTATLFRNLQAPLPPAECSSADRGTCTVGRHLEKTLAYLATEGEPGLTAPEAQDGGTECPHAAWAKSACRPLTRIQAIEWVTDNPLFLPRLKPALVRSRVGDLWACTLSWGVGRGELVWHRELGFMLEVSTRRVIEHSFSAMNTP